MTRELRGQVAYGFAALVTTAVYVAWLVLQLRDTDPADIEYVLPLLWTIGASMVIHAVGGAFVRGARPQDRIRDERDRDINRRADALSFYVFSALAVLPLVLALAGAEPFWFANVLFLAFALTAVLGVAARIVLDRRGL